jgi:uncharacterized protein YkvS
VKVKNGIANIVGKIGNAVVVVQVKLSETYTSIHIRVLRSVTEAAAVIEGYMSPLVRRVVSFQNAAVGRVDSFRVSFRDGLVSLKGAIDERFVHLQARLSEFVHPISMRASSGINCMKEAISDLAGKLLSLVSETYVNATTMVSLLCSSIKDGVVNIVCKVNDRIVVFRIKAAEVIEYLQSKSQQMCGSTYASIADRCRGAKQNMLRASEVTTAKSRQVGNSIRDIVSNPKAQVTAASAAGGAVALGTSGGAAGLLSGGAIGAVMAVPAAFFTFGLSIPVGASVGAGAGLCIGTVAGGTTGLVTGGAAGYSAHRHKDKIGNGCNGAVSKAKEYKAFAAASTTKLRAQILACTGSTVAAA